MNVTQAAEALLQDWDNRPETEFLESYLIYRIKRLRQAVSESKEPRLPIEQQGGVDDEQKARRNP